MLQKKNEGILFSAEIRVVGSYTDRLLNWIQALRSFEYMNVLSCVYNELQYLYRRFNTTIKSSTEVHYFDLPHVC